MGGSGGRSVVILVAAALLALVGGQILPNVEDAVFTDTIRKMPAKEVKRFVRANGSLPPPVPATEPRAPGDPR